MIDAEHESALRVAHPRVASIGSYILDVLGRPVSELPVGQTGSLLDEIKITPAGTAGGTAVDLARLGARVIAFGAIGTDLAGDMLKASLEAENVDTSRFVRKDGVQTSATILPIHPDGSRPAWHVPGANSLLGIDDIRLEELDGCDVVHLGGLTALPGLDGPDAAQLLSRARAAGALTTADCLGVKGDDPLSVVAPVLPHVDVFMPNDGEALMLSGEADVFAAARKFRELGARTVIVKRGPDGCLIDDDAGVRTLPAHVATPVDTTGCGDAFCAGVIVALSVGWEIDDAARLGGATGALNLRALGSDAGAKDIGEALAYLHETPLREPAATR